MAISIAVEKHGFVEVYDERNHMLFMEQGKLHGYTSNSVSVKKSDGYIHTYDDKRHRISMVKA